MKKERTRALCDGESSQTSETFVYKEWRLLSSPLRRCSGGKTRKDSLLAAVPEGRGKQTKRKKRACFS